MQINVRSPKEEGKKQKARLGRAQAATEARERLAARRSKGTEPESSPANLLVTPEVKVEPKVTAATTVPEQVQDTQETTAVVSTVAASEVLADASAEQEQFNETEPQQPQRKVQLSLSDLKPAEKVADAGPAQEPEEETPKRGRKAKAMKAPATKTKKSKRAEMVTAELEEEDGDDGGYSVIVSDTLTLGFLFTAVCLPVVCAVVGYVISDAMRILLVAGG